MGDVSAVINITYPIDVKALSSADVNIGGRSVGNIVVLPSPSGVSLRDGQTASPGAARLISNGIFYSLDGQLPQITVLYENPLTANPPLPSTAAGNSISAKPQGLASSMASQTSSQALSDVQAVSSEPTAMSSAGSSFIESPAASTTSKSRPVKSTSSVSPGATAGIAIGSSVAGALIAGLLLWLCWYRKRAPRSRYSQTNIHAMASQEKGFSANDLPLVGQRNAVAAYGGTLPQPLEDRAISGDVSKISNAIKNHIQSYYHTSRVSSGLIDYDDIQALGQHLPISVGTLSTLMTNSTTREIALRFIVAWTVVSRMRPSGDSSKTLLPSELAYYSQGMKFDDRGSQATLMARWRVMTAELLQPTYVRNAFASSDSRNESIRAAFDAIDNILQPYADSRMNNEERKRNLEELLKRAAMFAFTLFSQPSSWEFEWQEEQGVSSGELCIFPALVQVTDETGQPVSPPRPFSEAVVRRLDA